MEGVLGRRRPQRLVFWLDDKDLGASDADGWRQFLALIGPALGREIHTRSFSGAPPKTGDFAFLSDSAALTRTLCLSLDDIYLSPTAVPVKVDPYFSSPWADTELAQLDFQPAQPDVSLISSIFDGDEFISGFLANCALLQNYAAIQHFLISVPSEGCEGDALIRHVRQHPQAVWVNLGADPGLYEVWNLGCRLATGRFLSNANIDDRRAPGQVTYLQKILTEHPEVDVASAALRVSSQRNLDWNKASDCSLMFTEGEDRIYGVTDLFQTRASGLASRNLPHCMPLWRRSLHARVGEFNERMFGPSADWAFWLQAGEAGSLFHHSVEPLGVYLRDAATYWRRSGAGPQADTRTLAAWGHLARGALQGQRQARAHLISPILLRLPALFANGAGLIGLGQLLFAARLVKHQKNVSTGLLARLADQYLGISDVEAWAAEAGELEGSADWSEIVLFNALVGALKQFDPLRLGARTNKIARNLTFACLDWQSVGGALQASLLMAFLEHQRGDSAREATLLRSAHGRDRGGFWSAVQRVYRFITPLPALSAAVGDLPAAVMHASSASSTRIFCYPRYTFNLYLTMLYAPLTAAGGIVQGTRDSTHFLEVDPLPNRENILHVHWVSPFFEGNVTPQTIQTRAQEFLSGLRRQQARGFKVFWTIHNRISHGCVSLEDELAFRRELYSIADQVFVHHPMAAELLDWLPDRHKLQVYEHGAYPAEAIGKSAKEVRNLARSELGLAQEDFVLSHVGQVRAYKGLGPLLPALADWLDHSPRAKFLIAGSISAPEVKAWLAENAHPQIIIQDGFLSEADLALQMHAADVGFLAYDQVLTSGTLIHWFSEGRPVLAPPKGTIPAHLAPGWNGFFYSDSDALGRVLDRLYYAEADTNEILSKNAYATARYLEWKPWEY